MDASNFFSKLVPASAILPQKNSPKDKILKFAHTKQGVLFSYLVVLQTLNAILDLKYTDFDPITSTRCCHGAAIFTKTILSNFNFQELTVLRREGWEAYFSLQGNNSIDFSSVAECEWDLPPELILLAQVYLLSIVKKPDDYRCYSVYPQKLRELFCLNDHLSRKIIRRLQRLIANMVVKEYINKLQKSDQDLIISGFPLRVWGEFVLPPNIRTDREQKKFVASLYSNQLVIGYIISSNTPVAIVNDVRDADGSIVKREFQLYLNSGSGQLEKIDSGRVKEFDPNLPVVIYGGASSSQTGNALFNEKGQRWLDAFSELILITDSFCPHFPRVAGDPDFCDEPIVPDNQFLIDKLLRYSKIPGFCAIDSSVFCLSHIYLASMKQIQKEFIEKKEGTLPYSRISTVAKKTTMEYVRKFRHKLLNEKERLQASLRKIA